MKNKVFCEICRKEVDYNVVIDKNGKVKILDFDIPFEEKKAYCKECGSEVYSEKVSDYNLDQIQKYISSVKKTTKYDVDYPLFSTVYIIDRFDIENNCSQWGDGSGSKKIQNKVRECFVTQISVCGKDKESGRLYYVQPRKLTEAENNGIKNFYFEKSFYAKELYKSREQAEEKLKEKEI